jgi:hypothetical protein
MNKTGLALIPRACSGVLEGTRDAISHCGVTTKSGHATLNTPSTRCLTRRRKRMAAEHTALYYARLVRRLNELQAPECKECPGRLACAVNQVLHPSSPQYCGCRA